MNHVDKIYLPVPLSGPWSLGPWKTGMDLFAPEIPWWVASRLGRQVSLWHEKTLPRLELLTLGLTQKRESQVVHLVFFL